MHTGMKGHSKWIVICSCQGLRYASEGGWKRVGGVNMDKLFEIQN